MSDKIKILKAMYLQYTEIFAQILDSSTEMINGAEDRQQTAIENQGIPTIKHRFYHKIFAFNL